MSKKQVKQEDKKRWTFGNVFSAWMSTIFITLVMFMMSEGNEFLTKATGIALGVVAAAITVEYIMKKRTF